MLRTDVHWAKVTRRLRAPLATSAAHPCAAGVAAHLLR
jgi:hypothetical protein